MLAEARLQKLHAFVNTFSKEDLAWIDTEIRDIHMDLFDLHRIFPVKRASHFEEQINILNQIIHRLHNKGSGPASVN